MVLGAALQLLQEGWLPRHTCTLHWSSTADTREWQGVLGISTRWPRGCVEDEVDGECGVGADARSSDCVNSLPALKFTPFVSLFLHRYADI